MTMGIFGKKKKTVNVEDLREAALPPLTIASEDSDSVIVVATEYYTAAVNKLPKRKPFPVILVREPHNKHDSGAVAVTHKGQTIGYLSEFRASKYGPIMDAIGRSLATECTPQGSDHHVALPKPLDLAKQIGPATAHLLEDLAPAKSFFLKGGPKYYEQTGQLLEESNTDALTATIVADTLPTGKWAGQPRYRFWVGERCIGEATSRYRDGNEWLFDYLATGVTEIEVRIGRHEETGPWARISQFAAR